MNIDLTPRYQVCVCLIVCYYRKRCEQNMINCISFTSNQYMNAWGRCFSSMESLFHTTPHNHRRCSLFLTFLFLISLSLSFQCARVIYSARCRHECDSLFVFRKINPSLIIELEYNSSKFSNLKKRKHFGNSKNLIWFGSNVRFTVHSIL